MRKKRKHLSANRISAGDEIAEGQLSAFASLHGIPSFMVRLAQKHGVRFAVAETETIRHKRD